MCLGVLRSPPQSDAEMKYLFSSAWLSFLQEFTTQKKAYQQIYLNIRFKDVICLFCCQGHLKQFLENYVFCQNLEMIQVVKGGGGGGSFCLRHYDAVRTKIGM